MTGAFTVTHLYRVHYRAWTDLIVGWPLPDRDVTDAALRELTRRMGHREWPSFAEAWNDITSSSKDRPGRIEFWAHVRCEQCNGKRVDLRLGQVCANCVGQGRKHARIALVTRWANPDPPHLTADRR